MRELIAANAAEAPASGISTRLFRWSAYHSVLLAAVTLSIIFMFNQANSTLLDVSIALYVGLAITWLVVAISCVLHTGVRRDDRGSMVWFSFLVTAILWIISLFTFEFYPLVFGVPTPTPSLTDLFEIAGYFPLLFGLLMQVSPFKAALSSRSMKSVMIIVAILSVSILYFVLPQFFRMNGDNLAVAVTVAYPVLDVICLSIAIPILALFIRGTFWRPFLCVVVGLLFLLVADIISGETILQGTYFLGHPSDLIYDFGLLSGILGWHLRKKQFVTRSL